MQRLRTAFIFLAVALTLSWVVACGPQRDQEIEGDAATTTGETTSEEMPAEPMPAATASATLQGRAGSDVSGEVTFTEVEGGVQIVAHVSGLTNAGPHGFHLHEVGDCSAEDFTSAGGHFNPTGVPHGAPTDAEHHAGDFGNIEVGEDGTGHLELVSHMLTVSPGPNSVVGKAVILHEQADDLESQPTGAAGGRVACGVVQAAGGSGETAE
jgi:Cu-Zn family superoxide dismutase